MLMVVMGIAISLGGGHEGLGWACRWVGAEGANAFPLEGL